MLRTRSVSAFLACMSVALLSAWFIMFPRDTSISDVVTQIHEQHDYATPINMAKGELVMIVASSGNKGLLGLPGIKEMVYENRMSYAAKWGHEFMWADMASYNFSKVAWNKIPIIQDAHIRYPKAKWFWWLDMDAIIMNASLDIYDHLLSPKGMNQSLLLDTDIPALGGGPLGFRTASTIEPEHINMLITFDAWGMNTGSFLMRRSEWTDMVLELWADPLAIEKDWIFYDQDGWVHMYQAHEFVRRHTGIVKQKVLNGYVVTNPLGKHWEAGDLLIHFAGCGAVTNVSKCYNKWKDHWERRQKDDTPEWILRQIADGTAPIENIRPGKS